MTSMAFRFRKRPSLASCSSRSRADSLASRFWRKLGLPLGFPGRQGFEIDLIIGLEQIARQFLTVDPQSEKKHVVDDVLGEIETRIEDMIAGGPADFDPVGAREALPAGHILGDFRQLLRAENFRARP